MDVLGDKQMTVPELVAAVQQAGYLTTSPNFRIIVQQRLADADRFRRVKRGLYAAASRVPAS